MHFRIFLLAALSCLVIGQTQAQVPARRNVSQAGPVAPPNLARDLKSLLRAIPKKQIRDLVHAYLLNDAEFQAVIRAINSIPAYRARQSLLNQPEVRQLILWVGQQLLLSGAGSWEIVDDLEISIFNKYPYWAQTVQGIRGFQLELASIYPVELVRSLLESSGQQSPVLGELWRRLLALKPAYERWLALPQVRTVINRLGALGVDLDGVDAIVRYQLGWSNATFNSYPDYDYRNYPGF
ncbi:uncharacterized protein LOC115622422 [Scaptodrosophila lebanonensis]|uniref:Uncharacterized protein LOC115622422 n=1 Tax=Drosophila lebanonensis TaxID=7225 RepID=A0A6J2TB90_DROLE|nr:uncharacterized protein LOC115622422 [Scaptodrosophila lebanonensis]